MPKIAITNLSSIGRNFDSAIEELPPNVFSDALNIRFRNGQAETFAGISAASPAPSVAPYYALPLQYANIYYWIYCGASSIYSFDGATHVDRTQPSTTYNYDPDIGWTGGVLSGVPILNTGRDNPQVWLDPSVATATFVDLPNWNYTETIGGTTWTANRARVIRPFGYFLVALGVTKDDGTTATEYPYLVKWSSPAAPGQVPNSWDETDPTKETGEIDLAEGGGFVVDCLPMRGTNFIYRENSTHSMRYVGGQSVFAFQQVFTTIGALSPRGIKEFFGKHIVLANGDVVVHNGVDAQSIVTKRMRDWLFSRISSTNYRRCFIVPNYTLREMWICFPEEGQEYANLALVWNWEDNTFTVRELPGLAHIAFGIAIGNGPSPWDSSTSAWDAGTAKWDARTYSPTQLALVGAQPGGPNLVNIGQGEQDLGSNKTCRLERVALALAGRKLDGSPRVDTTKRKLLTAVYPDVEFEIGNTLNVYVGASESANGTINWVGPLQFDPGTMDKVNCAVSGKYLAVRFETTDASAWKLRGYSLDVSVVGSYG